MKSRQIKDILQKKLNSIGKTIDSNHIRTIIKERSIITGGSIVSLLLNENVNDYDIYFKSQDDVKDVCIYYCNKFNETHKDSFAWVLDGRDVEAWKQGSLKLQSFTRGYEDLGDIDYKAYINNIKDAPVMLHNTSSDRIKIIICSKGVAGDVENIEVQELFDEADHVPAEALEQQDDSVNNKPKYRPIFLTTNAISLSNKVQLIIRFYGGVDEIHKNFDFIHATCSYDAKTGELNLPARALEAIINKELFYSGSLYPVASIVRIRKFIKRGWHINAGQILKIAMQISDLNLTDINVLEDQLMGVDTVYFNQLIDILRKEQIDPERLKSDYVSSIIDKIF